MAGEATGFGLTGGNIACSHTLFPYSVRWYGRSTWDLTLFKDFLELDEQLATFPNQAAAMKAMEQHYRCAPGLRPTAQGESCYDYMQAVEEQEIG